MLLAHPARILHRTRYTILILIYTMSVATRIEILLWGTTRLLLFLKLWDVSWIPLEQFATTNELRLVESKQLYSLLMLANYAFQIHLSLSS